MPRRFRSNASLVVSGALLVFSLMWLLVGLRITWTVPVLGWLPLPLMALLAGHACWRVTRERSLGGPVRRFWAQLGAATGLLAVGLCFNINDALGGPEPSQRISFVTFCLYLSLCLVALWALLRLPVWQRSRSDWSRFGLDAGIVLITSGELVWLFSLRKLDVWASLTGSMLSILASSWCPSVSVVAFIKVAFAGAGPLDRTALRILAFGATRSPAPSAGSTPLLAGWPYLSTTFVAVATAASRYSRSPPNRQLRAPAYRPPSARSSPAGSASCPTWRSPRRTRCCSPSVPGASRRRDLVAFCAVAADRAGGDPAVTALRENGRLLGTVDANLQQLRGYQEQLAHQVSHDSLTEIGQPLAVHREGQRAARRGRAVPRGAARPRRLQGRQRPARPRHRATRCSRRSPAAARARCAPADTVARLGGDEFALLLPDLDRRGDRRAAAAAGRAGAGAAAAGGHELVARVSIGVPPAGPATPPRS